MYLAIDVGGTKTLVAVVDDAGVIQSRDKFPTAKNYADFRRELAESIAKLTTTTFVACGVGVPGRIDRQRGVGLAMGNLPWHNVPVRDDIAKLVACPIVVENDAKLAGLSEAMLLKNEYNSVLYVTIGTGIGTALIVNQTIEPALADAEAGKMPLEYHGKLVAWEDFASGRALKEHYGQEARDITDPATWQEIAHKLAIGLIDVLAITQPEVIVLGGGVSAYFDRLEAPLKSALAAYEVPLIPIPPLREAARPEDAVLFGAYDLAKSLYGTADS